MSRFLVNRENVTRRVSKMAIEVREGYGTVIGSLGIDDWSGWDSTRWRGGGDGSENPKRKKEREETGDDG